MYKPRCPGNIGKSRFTIPTRAPRHFPVGHFGSRGNSCVAEAACGVGERGGGVEEGEGSSGEEEGTLGVDADKVRGFGCGSEYCTGKKVVHCFSFG